MLFVKAKIGERVYIGNDIELLIKKTQSGTISIGIAAPNELDIVREGSAAAPQPQRIIPKDG